MGLLGELKAADRLSAKIERRLKDMAADKGGPSIATDAAGLNGPNIPFLGRPGHQQRDVLGNVVAERTPRSFGGPLAASGKSPLGRVRRSLDGQHWASEEYLNATCTLTEITVPSRGRLGGGFSGGSEQMKGWKCPDGSFFPLGDSGIETTSGSTAGGSGGSRGAPTGGGAGRGGGGSGNSLPPPGTIPPSTASPDAAVIVDALMTVGRAIVGEIRGDGGASLRLSGGW